MRRVVVVAFVLALVSHVCAGIRTVSEPFITLGDWDFVPTLRGPRVETFLALRDPSLAVGSNVTAVWFRRTDDGTWQAVAWREPGNLKAIAWVKLTLELPDWTDSIWPDDRAQQQGVDTDLAVAPDTFAKGVFADDDFAPVIETSSDPVSLLEALTASGWASATIAVQTETTGCSQDQILSTMAAMVEADIGTGANGAIADTFTVPDTDCDLWRSLAGVLDDDGQWAVPDYTDYISATTSIDPEDVWQGISPGLVLTGPQTVVIDAGGVDGSGNPYVAAKLVVGVEDVTAPMLSLEVLGDGVPPMVSPGGLDYFVAPVTISTETEALDNVDGLVTTTVLPVDAEIGCIGPGPVVLSDTGFYRVRASVTDAAGNTTFVTKLFEVRDRFDYEAAAAIADVTVTPGTDTDLVDATVLLTAEAFDATDINLATVQVWLKHPDGQLASAKSLALSPGWLSGGAYDPGLVALDSGIWYISVQGEVPHGALSGPDVQFTVTGGGLDGLPEAFDFMTVMQPFEAQADPEAAVLAQATPVNTTSTPPSPPPAPPCRWVGAFFVFPPMEVTETWVGLCANYMVDVKATPVTITGSGIAVSTQCLMGQDAYSGPHWAASGGNMQVYMQPPHCCTNCSFDVVARPSFEAHVQINPPGTAVAAGYIKVNTTCGNTAASGALGVGSFASDPTVRINGEDYPVTVVEDETEATREFSGDLHCTYEGCTVLVDVSTGALISVSASSNNWNWTGSASGVLRDSNVGVTVTPSSNGSCTIQNDGKPFTFGGGTCEVEGN